MNPGWFHFAILNGWSTVDCACWRSAAFTADATGATVLLFLLLFCSLTLNHTHNYLKIDCIALEGGTLKGAWANSGLARWYPWKPHGQAGITPAWRNQLALSLTLKAILWKILTSPHTYQSPKVRRQKGMRAEIHKDCLIQAAKNYSQTWQLKATRQATNPWDQPITKLEGKVTGHIGGVQLCVNTYSHISISKPNVNNNNWN